MNFTGYHKDIHHHSTGNTSYCSGCGQRCYPDTPCFCCIMALGLDISLDREKSNMGKGRVCWNLIFFKKDKKKNKRRSTTLEVLVEKGKIIKIEQIEEA